jgi:NAD dependent epimerase/dehydratase
VTFNLNSKSILVTGAGGFIGSQLVQSLIEKGAHVRAFVRYNSRGDKGLLKYLPSKFQPEMEVIAGDLRDEQAVEQAARGVDTIFHLGALISIPYSYIHPFEVIECNMMGSLNVLNACRKFDCKLIHTSTSEVYGTGIHIPMNEEHPLRAQSPYSASKIAADKIVESYQKSFDVHAVTVRPFNTYGPGQSARAVIPTIITQALTSNEIHLGNLETQRDFTYLTDTVNGFIKAAETENIDGETFNLGSGKEITIADLAEKIIRLVGRSVSIKVDPVRLRPEKSEVMRLLSDNSKALNRLGWQPQVDIQTGLEQTIHWIEQHLDNYLLGKYEF